MVEIQIPLSAAVEAIRNAAPNPSDMGNAQHFVNAIRTITPAKVAPDVRCRDCEYFHEITDGKIHTLFCANHSGLARVNENSYCCYWKRRNGE